MSSPSLVELEGNFAAYLARLRCLLDPGNLPASLPLHDEASESIYGAFLNFTIDPKILEKTGDDVGAFSEQLKAVFGQTTLPTDDGIISIKERGRALSAVVDVLSQFHEKYPNNAVVQKWGFDIGKGVEKIYQTHGHEFPSTSTKAFGSKHLATCTSNNAKSTKKAGRPPVDLMNKAITKGALDTGKKYWKCISSDCGYMAFGNAQQERVYKHAAGCEALGRTHPDVRQAIVDLQSETSLGAPPQQGSASACNCHSEPPSSRASSPVSSSKKQKVDGKICNRAREGGKAKEREERETMQQAADRLIMQLICRRGLDPDVLDSPEWKELMHFLNPNYNPMSASAARARLSESTR